MIVKKAVFGIIFMCILTAPTNAETLSREHLKNQATNFLELLDQGLFEDAWSSMSPFFQSLHTKAQWMSRQLAIRAAYGPLSVRQLRNISLRESYTHSADGQYAIVQFQSGFLHKIETIESVVLDCRNSSECTLREYVIR